MKSAVLMLLFAPSAFSQTVGRFSGAPAAAVAPSGLQPGSMSALTPSLQAGPALSMSPALIAPSLAVQAVQAAPAVGAAPVALAVKLVPAAAKAVVPGAPIAAQA